MTDDQHVSVPSLFRFPAPTLPARVREKYTPDMRDIRFSRALSLQSIIPARAGISGKLQHANRGSLPWVPALAGMTVIDASPVRTARAKLTDESGR